MLLSPPAKRSPSTVPARDHIVIAGSTPCACVIRLGIAHRNRLHQHATDVSISAWQGTQMRAAHRAPARPGWVWRPRCAGRRASVRPGSASPSAAAPARCAGRTGSAARRARSAPPACPARHIRGRARLADSGRALGAWQGEHPIHYHRLWLTTRRGAAQVRKRPGMEAKPRGSVAHIQLAAQRLHIVRAEARRRLDIEVGLKAMDERAHAVS